MSNCLRSHGRYGNSQAGILGGLPFPSPRDLPDLGIQSTSPALKMDSLLLSYFKNIVVLIVQLLSHVQLFASPWLKPSWFPCPSLFPGVRSNSCPLSRWYYLTTSFCATPFSSFLQSFPATGSFLMSQLFASRGQSIGASASDLPVKGWLVWSPYSPRDPQEPSPEPWFESICSSALSLIYVSALTSVHYYWKIHSFDCMDLCQQSDVFDF